MSPFLLPRRLALALALALPLVGAAASPLQLSLVDRASGQTLPVYEKDGRVFSPGQPGRRYAIRLRNASAERLLVVLSVDGVNAVSGQTAAWHQTGYVLDPWQSADISGWRKSDQQVAAFEFAALSDSYAALTGRPDQVGVIGAAVFTEAVPLPQPAPQLGDAEAAMSKRTEAGSLRGRADAAPAAAAPAERLGTAHGRREWSPVGHTAFERRSKVPAAIQEIWYDSVPNLIAAGVLPAQRVAQARAFPASPGYVPDPPPRW